ncbi:MAG TPA: hypothetical protein DEQ43_26485 [Nocardioides bacterium]|nr:hypothetical protein [Nocardioides sp.]
MLPDVRRGVVARRFLAEPFGPLAGRQRQGRPDRRHQVGLVDHDDLVEVRLDVALGRRGQRGDIRDRCDDDPLAGEVVEPQDAQPVAPAGPGRQDDVPGERVGPLQPLVGVLGPQRQPGRGVLVARAWHRAAGQAVLRGTVVGHQQQLVGPVGVAQVLGDVLDPPPASADRAGRRGRV